MMPTMQGPENTMHRATVRKVVAAFDSFKGCLSAREACEACAQGIGRVLPHAAVVQLPLSDGGEGLVECVRRLLPSRPVTVEVHGPLMEPVTAEYAVSMDGRTAYMEMAAASGLTLVPVGRRDVMRATTYGVGEMMADAVSRGCTEIVMGIGGSATCDGGRGMIEALGDCRRLASRCRVTVACDVDNPLYGERGAACIFAPQKGASPEQVRTLDARLRDFARATERAGLATPLLALHPGAGAAGGLGYALMAYLNADLRSGIDIMLELAHFDDAIRDADLVITGEGRSDAQTLMGKVPYGVLARCRREGVKVWLLSGAVDDTEGQLSTAFDLVAGINDADPRPLAVLMQPEVARHNLAATVARLVGGAG